MHEVPITGLGSDGVGSEESHSVDLGLRIVLSRESATDDVIVVNLPNGQIQLFWNPSFRHSNYNTYGHCN